MATIAGIPVVDAAPWVAALATYIERNDIGFRARARRSVPAAEAGALSANSRAALDECGRCSPRAATIGLVRRGHGDLHLGNVALIDGEPVLFDAIEFSPLIAEGDVLYDLAFLLINLVERELGASPMGAQPLSRRKPGGRRLDTLAALPVHIDARRHPGQCHGVPRRHRGSGRAAACPRRRSPTILRWRAG